MVKQILQGSRNKFWSLFASKNDVLCFFAGLMIAAGGFGRNDVYIFAVAVALFAAFAERIADNWKWTVAILLFISALLIFPPLLHSTSFLALLFTSFNKRRIATGLLISQISLLASPYLAVSSQAYSPFLSAASFLAWMGFSLISFGRKPVCSYIVFISYAVLLTCSSQLYYQLPPAITGTNEPGYNIGDAIEKITGQQQSGVAYLVYKHHRDSVTKDASAVYLDHDAHSVWDEGNYIQPRPWGNQYIIGGEPLRMAIARDSVLITNLGAALKKDSPRLLYGLFDEGRVQPMAILHEQCLILSDSDFLVNCLAPYQPSLIRKLTGTDYDMQIFHFACSVALILSCFSSVSLFLPILLAGGYAVINLSSQPGEIRYEGKKSHWPHTNLGEGIVRTIQKEGYNVLFGNKEARILVVGSYQTASAEDERLIILEPGAKVYINSCLYEAGNLPAGIQQGIVDARLLKKNGIPLDCPVIKENSMTIIGSGSPALLNLDFWKEALSE